MHVTSTPQPGGGTFHRLVIEDEITLSDDFAVVANPASEQPHRIDRNRIQWEAAMLTTGATVGSLFGKVGAVVGGLVAWAWAAWSYAPDDD